MSKPGSYASRRGAPHHRRRRGGRRPGGLRPPTAAAQRSPPQRSVSPGTATPAPDTRSRVQKLAPDLSYVRRDLIRVGLVSGVTVLIMIILWLVL